MWSLGKKTMVMTPIGNVGSDVEHRCSIFWFQCKVQIPGLPIVNNNVTRVTTLQIQRKCREMLQQLPCQ
jgi:hypothetical protein